MSELNLAFPDQIYTEANPPSASTLKSDLSAVELGHNAHEADETNPHSVTAAQTGAAAFDEIYPVGSIYINAAVATNPGTLLGQGTWVAFGAGKVPVGVDSGDTDFDVVNSSTGSAGTGGTKTVDISHTHTGASHTHTIANDTGNARRGDDAADVSDAGHNHGGATGADGTGETSSAGSATQSIIQPYITVYMWRRSA